MIMRQQLSRLKSLKLKRRLTSLFTGFRCFGSFLQLIALILGMSEKVKRGSLNNVLPTNNNKINVKRLFLFFYFFVPFFSR